MLRNPCARAYKLEAVRAAAGLYPRPTPSRRHPLSRDDKRSEPYDTPTLAADPVSTPASSLSSIGDAPPQLVGGRYRVLGLLGTGGMGSVYRALDTELDEQVALKMLRRDLVDSERALELFRREVKLARRVTHPNVARTFDIGEHEGDRFLTMEVIDGEPLASVLARTERLPPARVVELCAPICAGLSAAHAAGVVHRDLKPDNVMLGRDGRVVITDFGVARTSASNANATVGVAVGTPAYMAPEQVRGAADIDQRADIYALGVMLFEMLTGELPFKGDSPFMVAMARLDSEPPDVRRIRPELGAALSATVRRCMARDRDARFSGADEVARALSTLGPTALSAAAPLHHSAQAFAETLPGTTPSVVVPIPTQSADFLRSVAVLPFRNGGPPDDDYIADGLTEDLIDTLSMTRGLRVRPRALVARFSGQDVDPRQVGEELDVQVVVDGSVRRRGDSLRVAARLLSVSDGFQLWARRFDRAAADLLVVSDEAAAAIAEALTVDASAQHRQAPSDPVAVDLYLRARAELRKSWGDAVERAVELFREARQRAPGDPTILSGYARALARNWFFKSEEAPALATEARSVAERAVAEAPESGEAWLALASVRSIEGRAPEAVRALRSALVHAPALAEAHELLGALQLETDRLPDAIRRLDTALELDPSLRRPRVDKARAYALLGKWDEVQRLLDEMAGDDSDLVSSVVMRARLALWSPDPAPLLANLRAFEPGPMGSPTLYAKLVVDLIQNDDLPLEQSKYILEAAAQPGRAARFRTLLLQLATEVLAYACEVDAAMAQLEEAVAGGLIDNNWLELCPLLEPLRSHPRFVALHQTVAARAAEVTAALRGR